MASTQEQLYNRAVSAVGGRAKIASVTETSREAEACELWYPLVRQNVLKSASWPCAKKYVQLILASTRDFGEDWAWGDPAPTWKYAYFAPDDMLAPRYLTTYARFRRASEGSESLLYTNQEDAVLHYVFDQDDYTAWDSGLEQAIIYALAAHICTGLTGKRSLAEDLRQKALEFILQAQTEFANESDDIQDTLPSYIEARGYGELPRTARFTYPYEELNGMTT